MYRLSSCGLGVLLLVTSCVPPAVQGPRQVAAAVPDASRNTGTVGPFIPLAPMEGPALTAAGENLAAPVAAAQPFSGLAQSGEDAGRAIECLTAAVYYEARSEPLDGQRAVAQVVLNRVRSGAFPDSVCGVVYQGANRPTGCQFTFACDGSTLFRRDALAWDRARQVAQAALDGSVYAPIGTATYYHTTAILPWWAPSLQRVATIGAHIFYRWPGAAGSPAAFSQRYAGVEPGSSAPAMASVADGYRSVVSEVAGVSVHRGGDGVSLSAMEGASQAGVRVHFGLPQSSTPETAAATDDVPVSADAASVKVHTGTAPGAA